MIKFKQPQEKNIFPRVRPILNSGISEGGRGGVAGGVNGLFSRKSQVNIEYIFNRRHSRIAFMAAKFDISVRDKVIT